MTINLKPETERIVEEELQNGNFRSVDEMIVEGVQARREGKPLSRALRRKTPSEAVAHIRELRQGNRLSAGVTIKDLKDDGRACRRSSSTTLSPCAGALRILRRLRQGLPLATLDEDLQSACRAAG